MLDRPRYRGPRRRRRVGESSPSACSTARRRRSRCRARRRLAMVGVAARQQIPSEAAHRSGRIALGECVEERDDVDPRRRSGAPRTRLPAASTTCGGAGQRAAQVVDQLLAPGSVPCPRRRVEFGRSSRASSSRDTRAPAARVSRAPAASSADGENGIEACPSTAAPTSPSSRITTFTRSVPPGDSTTVVVTTPALPWSAPAAEWTPRPDRGQVPDRWSEPGRPRRCASAVQSGEPKDRVRYTRGATTCARDRGTGGPAPWVPSDRCPPPPGRCSRRGRAGSPPPSPCSRPPASRCSPCSTRATAPRAAWTGTSTGRSTRCPRPPTGSCGRSIVLGSPPVVTVAAGVLALALPRGPPTPRCGARGRRARARPG